MFLCPLAGTASNMLGVWIHTDFNYLPNRRGGLNLVFNGFLYTSERRYNSTVNWVCNKNSNLHLKCPARCVTSGDKSIKLSKKLHNHDPIYDQAAASFYCESLEHTGRIEALPQRLHGLVDVEEDEDSTTIDTMMVDSDRTAGSGFATVAPLMDVSDIECWMQDC